MPTFSTRLLFVSALLLSALTGMPTLAAPPGSVEALQGEAQALVLAKDYVGAAAKLEVAIAKAPQQAGSYLQLCDVLEALGQHDEAQSTLKQGLQAVAGGDSLKTRLSYRSGLLAALKQADRKTAEAALKSLPAGAEQSDLRGVLALLEGQNQTALERFAEALPKAGSTDAEARIHYHAALAHHAAVDLDNAMASLFNAINKAESLALIKDIEKLWGELYPLQLKSRQQ